MKKETVTQYLHRRLDAAVGLHDKIAKETGVSQATISRIYLRNASPTLATVEPILAWFEKRDRAAKRASKRRKSTSVVSSALAGRVRRSVAVSAPAPIGQ